MNKDMDGGDPVTRAIYRVFADLHPWGSDLPYPFSEYVERIAPVAASAVLDALGQEERFVPVAESGERWAPRSREAAECAMRGWPSGGTWEGSDDPYDGITHIAREVRIGTTWTVAESIDADGYLT